MRTKDRNRGVDMEKKKKRWGLDRGRVMGATQKIVGSKTGAWGEKEAERKRYGGGG